MVEPPVLTVKAQRRVGDFSLDLDWRLPCAGVHALFGPSGSGKTTALRIIAGLDRGNDTLRFGDETWAAPDAPFVPAHARRVGLVFQDVRLFDHLDVAGNLRFAMARSGAGAQELEDVTDRLDLGPLLGRDCAGLSGGERQRVGLGRALLARPRLLLLDEPLSALDGRRKREILPYLQTLTERFAIPTIFVSHAIEDVVQLARDVSLMEAGRIACSGPVEDMVARPELQALTGRFEAGAVLRAQVVRHDAAYQLTVLDIGGQELVMPMIAGLQIGQMVPLRLRARDVSLARAPVEGLSIRNQLSGVVISVHAETQTAYAEVEVEVSGMRVRARITRKALADLQISQGMDIVALIKSVAFDRRGLSGR